MSCAAPKRCCAGCLQLGRSHSFPNSDYVVGSPANSWVAATSAMTAGGVRSSATCRSRDPNPGDVWNQPRAFRSLLVSEASWIKRGCRDIGHDFWKRGHLQAHNSASGNRRPPRILFLSPWPCRQRLQRSVGRAFNRHGRSLTQLIRECHSFQHWLDSCSLEGVRFGQAAGFPKCLGTSHAPGREFDAYCAP